MHFPKISGSFLVNYRKSYHNTFFYSTQNAVSYGGRSLVPLHLNNVQLYDLGPEKSAGILQ